MTSKEASTAAVVASDAVESASSGSSAAETKATSGTGTAGEQKSDAASSVDEKPASAGDSKSAVTQGSELARAEAFLFGLRGSKVDCRAAYELLSQLKPAEADGSSSGGSGSSTSSSSSVSSEEPGRSWLLGLCHFWGFGTKRDPAAALVEWKGGSDPFSRVLHAHAVADSHADESDGDSSDEDEASATDAICAQALPAIRAMAEGEKKDVRAMHMLGLMHQFGLGVDWDEEKACHWFAQAAEQGHTDALYRLGQAFRIGRGVDKRDESKALQLWSQAARRGCREAQFALASLLESGGSTGVVQKDPRQAAVWFREASKQGLQVIGAIGI